MDPDRYLARLGLDPEAAWPPTRETLARLQSAHVTTVPFETLSITGPPHAAADGEGVTLSVPALYEKLVERERGGFCYELNGLFGWLLDELGFEVDRLAAAVLGDDGDPRPPANHHALRVTLDEPYLVDVGLGVPKVREPVPIGGRAAPDAVGVEWRTVGSDRPDADYVAQAREPSDATSESAATDDGWSDRYLFTTAPRDLDHFTATCEYLTAAPESPFTGEPSVNVGTERGHRRLTTDSLVEVVDGEETERPVAPDEWLDVLEREFGVRYG
ncbi:arylamine N-acetyltransferase family protein [Natronomonas marina]|jgi:N-hydroxyarylamine O-acetyltransferase|uniref:arylamine N-acetyltransferase family protein n=1 Tax=Natronomonas marina TaxID=2961939 RepID=UPI0020C9A770|nr:arylamine N-acetyltransferase [Natronomonas marina]